MHFLLKTNVGKNTKEKVMSAFFNSEFFLCLAPPFPKLKLLRFDGSTPGNEIHLQLNFILYKQNWISLITEDGANENEIYFVDEGKKLPPPLKSWKHLHIVRQVGTEVEIEDNITYSSGSKILNLLMCPFFYLMFYYRKPIYKKYFSRKK